MYIRPNGYRYGGVRLPDNYSGSTFREADEESEEAVPPIIRPAEPSAPLQEQSVSTTCETKSIGSEELLLVALILLLSDRKENDELILLLALLLLAK